MKSLKYFSGVSFVLLMAVLVLGNSMIMAEAAICSGSGTNCPWGEANCVQVMGCRWKETTYTECYTNSNFTQTCTTTSSNECTGYAPCADQTTQASCDLVNGCQWSSSSGNTNDNDENFPPPEDGQTGQEEIPITGDGGGFGQGFSRGFSSQEGISAGAIVGIVIAILILHGAALGFWYYRKKQRGESNVHGATDRAAPIQAIKNHETVYRYVRNCCLSCVRTYVRTLFHLGGRLILTRGLSNLYSPPTISWVVFGLIIVTWIFTVAATGSCQFLSIDIDDKWGSGGEYGVGFFNFEDNDGCSRIEDKNELDEGLKAARTFAVFACLLTSTALVLVIAVQLLLNKGRDLCWLVIRVSIYCSSWCTLLTFLAFGSGLCDESDCKVGGVGVLTILNILLLVGLNILLFFIDAGPEPVLTIFKPSVGTVGTAPVKTNDIPEVVKITPSPEVLQDTTFPDEEEHAIVIENIENNDKSQGPTTSTVPQETTFPEDEEHAVIENIQNEDRSQEPTTSTGVDLPLRDHPVG